LRLAAAVAVAAAPAGCVARDDVILLLEVTIADAVPPPSSLSVAARVTSRDEAAVGFETVETATTVVRPWPLGERSIRLEFALGATAVAFDAELTLLSANGFPIAGVGAAIEMSGPGRYNLSVNIAAGTPPPPSDAGGGGSDSAAPASDAATGDGG
jgi:hypothetical protein